MLDFIFDAGFDGLLPGRAGERSRARRSARTLLEFRTAGTVTFPAARNSGPTVATGYLTARDRSIIFSVVHGSRIDHLDIDLTGITAFSVRDNRQKYLRRISRWWTLVELTGLGDPLLLACAPNGRDVLIEVLTAAGITRAA